MIALNDKGNILAAYYYYLAKANDGLKNDTKAVKLCQSRFYV
jgi:hypothetical protein